MLTLKAYNGRCVLEWLAVRVYEAYLNPQYAAFDPTRFCVIAGAMSLGGTLIARSDLQPNCVCESETGMRFCCWSKDGGQRFMFHQFVLQYWAHMHAIANNIKGVRWLSRHKFAIPHLYVFIGAKFLQKKMNPWAAQPLCWGSMLRDSLDWWKSMVGTWSLEAPNIARTTEVDQLFDEIANCAYGWWLICFDSCITNSQTSSSKIVSKERGRSLVDLWCWQTLFATVPEEYQVVTEAHQFSANHIVQELKSLKSDRFELYLFGFVQVLLDNLEMRKKHIVRCILARNNLQEWTMRPKFHETWLRVQGKFPIFCAI